MVSAPHLWAGFQEIVDSLEKHGVPRPSPSWMADVERFYLHPTALTWIGCVGRGGGKNLVGILCDLTELLFEDFGIPPGERHYHVHVSENTTEAKKTLRQMAQYLIMMAIPHTATADTIELSGELSDRGCKVLAARVGANSGFRSTGGTTQESAKWSGDDAANPAEEIVTSWAAQMVTHANARKRHFSTPMGREGFFYDALSRGEADGRQILTQGPTWKFNPSVSEETTKSLAPDPRVWRREYCGEPQAGAMSAFDADEIDAAIAHARPEGTPLQKHIIIDASSGRKDAFTYAVAGWVIPPRGAAWRPYLKVYLANEVSNEVAQKEGSDAVVGRIAAVARAHGVTTVHGDQREALFIRGAFDNQGLTFVQHDWTSKSKPAAVERVRTWLREGTLAIPDDPAKLRRELLSFEEKITPSGQFTFAARGNGHDDYAALLVTAAMAQLEGAFVAEEPDASCRIGKGNGRASMRAA